MTGPRIFVSYAREVEGDLQFARQLIDHLRDAGTDVVTLDDKQGETMNEPIVQMLHQKLLDCEWVLLVQTPDALRSAHVQMVINTALNLVVQQRIRGVLSVIAVPGEPQDIPPTWTTLKTFDASQDYPRALARLLLALNPAYATISQGTHMRVAPPPLLQPVHYTASERTITDGKPLPLARLSWFKQRRFQLWSIPLALSLILIVVVSMMAFARSMPHTGSVLPKHTPTPTATVHGAATPTAFTNSPQDLYNKVTQGKPVLDDPLSNQDINNWRVISTPSGNCIFMNGGYDVQAIKAGHRQSCIAPKSNFSNFAFQAQMTFVNGTGSCGLLVRVNGQALQSYRLYLNTDNTFQFFKVQNGHSSQLAHGQTPLNAGQVDVLTVIAVGSSFYVYINTQFVASVSDSTFASGEVGMVCRANPKPSEALFHAVKVWAL